MTAKKRQAAEQPPAEGDLLATLTRDDFAGGTAFRRLSAEQKLLWLVHAAAFALEARQARSGQTPPRGANTE